MGKCLERTGDSVTGYVVPNPKRRTDVSLPLQFLYLRGLLKYKIIEDNGTRRPLNKTLADIYLARETTQGILPNLNLGLLQQDNLKTVLFKFSLLKLENIN